MVDLARRSRQARRVGKTLFAQIALVLFASGCVSSPLYALGPYTAGDEAVYTHLEASVREAGYVPADSDRARGILHVPMRSAPAYFRVQATHHASGAYVLVVMEGAPVRYTGGRQRVSLSMQYEYDLFTGEVLYSELLGCAWVDGP